MKKYFLHLAVALLATTGLATSCTDSDDETPPVQPNFPEAFAEDILPNDSYTFYIEPNQNWSVSIPDSSREWFALDDNGAETSTLRGNAGRCAITVKSADREIFDDNHSVELTMTMGEGANSESRVIATFTIRKMEREVKIYNVKSDENGFLFNEDENAETLYIYDMETPATEVTIRLGGAFYTSHLLVVSNAGWKMAGLPEWITPMVGGETFSTGAAGKTEVELRVNNALLPVEGATAEGIKILANAAEEIELASFQVTFPSIAGTLDVSLVEEATFNPAGEYLAANTVGNALHGSINGLKGSQVFVIAPGAYGGYQVPVNWLAVDLDAWNDKDQSVIQQQNIAIKAEPNTTWQKRTAEIYILPATAVTEELSASGAEGLIDWEAETIKEAYQQYKVSTITQMPSTGTFSAQNETYLLSEGGQFILEESDPEYITDWGLSHLENNNYCYYKLTYKNEYASQAATLNLEEQYTSYKVFHYDTANETDALPADNKWVQIAETKAKDADGKETAEVKSIQIKMNFDQEYLDEHTNAEAFIVFYNEYGAIATIHCIYDENAVFDGGDSEGSLQFAYPQYATEYDNSTLVKLPEENELYQYYASEYGVTTVHHLTFTTPSPTMSAIKDLPEYGAVEEACKSWLSFMPGESGSVEMNADAALKEGAKTATGAIVFYKSATWSDALGGYADFQEPMFVLVCTLDLTNYPTE